ncbi:hypothetical protein [Lacticaseibacillus pantheris]|uniref:hypothetical protein n=1 Tax=Lacticaseibacillus pantheris TaxID=171523 RepID=UPI00265A4E95|nr:hypothetical protein [Lacticaseibacillus pantheris]WKF84586.1 hypothetical protein QY874_09890 [Lacticaseibacillus pantheris]
MSTIFINIVGIAIIVGPILILAYQNDKVSLKPLRPMDEQRPRFVIDLWFFQGGRRHVMASETYQPGKVIDSAQGGRYRIEHVEHLRRLGGLREHYELDMRRLPANANATADVFSHA